MKARQGCCWSLEKLHLKGLDHGGTLCCMYDDMFTSYMYTVEDGMQKEEAYMANFERAAPEKNIAVKHP